MSKNPANIGATFLAIVVGVLTVLMMPVLGRRAIERFKAENFATAVIAQNKEAFRRLSEM